MEAFFFIAIPGALGFGFGTLYERRKWRKATGYNRAEQYGSEKPSGGGGGSGKPGDGPFQLPK